MELVYKRFAVTEQDVDRTMSMLRAHSLWFSFPERFKGDPNDANIGAFFNKNPELMKIAERMDTLYLKRIKDSLMNGVCCFSKELPYHDNWSIYDDIPPEKTIIVSYRKVILEKFFAERGFGNCFSRVEYNYDPLSLKIKDGKININGKWIALDCLFSGTDPKSMDKLWEIMMSRITDKYSDEDEVRIILANENRPQIKGEDGYSEVIPSNAIYQIILPEGIGENIRERLKLLGKYSIMDSSV